MLQYTGNSDLQKVSLGSTYTSGSGTMSLTTGHGSRLPSKGNFWIRTVTGTYQCFKVTARSTDTLTVTAAQDGTSDGNLSAGTELQWVMSASALDELRADLNEFGQVLTPWDDSAASWINQGTANVVTRGGVTTIYKVSPSASDNVYCRLVSTPSTPYTITAVVKCCFAEENYPASGLILAEAGTTPKMIQFGPSWQSGGKLARINWNSPTSYNGQSNHSLYSVGKRIWLKIYNSGTNLTFSFSWNGEGYYDYITESVSAFLGTITQCGIGINDNCGSGNPGTELAIYHWKIT